MNNKSYEIMRSAIEQELIFSTEEDYEFYLVKLEMAQEPFEIVEEINNEDGSCRVVIRKQHGNTIFFAKNEQMSDQEFDRLMKLVFHPENEKIPEVKVPPQMFENIMAEIRKRETIRFQNAISEIVKKIERDELDCEDIIELDNIGKVILEFKDGVQISTSV